MNKDQLIILIKISLLSVFHSQKKKMEIVGEEKETEQGPVRS